jgi:hypothetical protein
MAEAQLAVPSGASLPVNSSAPSWATGVKRAARYTPSNTHNLPRGTKVFESSDQRREPIGAPAPDAH